MDKEILNKAISLGNTISDLETELTQWKGIDFDGYNYITSEEGDIVLTESDFMFIKRYFIDKLEKELSEAEEELDNL